ncbi:MAG: glucokinase [bacterium]
MLAGYITASQVHLARVKDHQGEVFFYDKMSFSNRDFSDFESILSLYMSRIRGTIDGAVFGVAGPVINNEVVATNIPWHLVGSSIEKKFGMKQVRLVNDLVAAAHGVFFLKEDRFYAINAGEAGRHGNIGLAAAGHGLGQAIIFYDGGRYRPIASEGGHAGFAPSTQLEVELWEYVYSRKQCVEVEDIVTLPGIETIYRFLIEHDRAVIADWFKKATDKPSIIIEKALSGSDEQAVKAIDTFIDCYAGEVANLALNGMTIGGIYLVGQVAPRIITLLDQGRFMERFVRKGKMEKLLASIPVKVVLEAQAALVGAGAMTISHRR